MRTDLMESLSKAIAKDMPKIQGVTWKASMYRLAEYPGMVRVGIEGYFDLDGNQDLGDFADQIGDKIDQITRGGQIKLELEK